MRFLSSALFHLTADDSPSPLFFHHTERKRNGGKSKYAPGQRRKIKLAEQRAKDLAVEEAAMRKDEQERQAEMIEAKKEFDAQMAAGGSGQAGNGAAAGPAPSPGDARSESSFFVSRLALVEPS